ncbi:hypothetical protein [Mesorhizobium sp. M0618]|uniref:hypothetical protein n=1 Tax=unclassified Mesorhizobium TaxID=325217 RepID=UPI00333C6306
MQGLAGKAQSSPDFGQRHEDDVDVESDDKLGEGEQCQRSAALRANLSLCRHGAERQPLIE